jgi:hypothetical protein
LHLPKKHPWTKGDQIMMIFYVRLASISVRSYVEPSCMQASLKAVEVASLQYVVELRGRRIDT